MKIALITLDYPPERGGVAQYLGSLVRYAKGAIDVFVNETHPTEGPGKVEAVKMLAQGPFAWRPMIGLIRSLRGRGYDHVLVSHVLPVGTAAWLARLMGGAKYSVIVHGLDLRLARMSARRSWIARQVLGRAHAVIANSEATAADVREFAPGARPIVITPGVDEPHSVSRFEARRKLSMPEEANIVLSVGRLVPRKGFDRLIEASASLPEDILIVIVGSGEDRERLEELAKKHGKNRIRFVANADDGTRDLWFSAADVFALPARENGQDVEGFGIVYLEAAAHGLPCIGGKSGGVPEAVLDGRTGILVDPENSADIAEAIHALFEDSDRRIAMGRAGRDRARSEFQWESRADALLESVR